jgi:DNA-binding NarL/FixJ family response regulator
VTRILIADDHEVVRSGLRSILEAHEGWQVVAEASDGKEAITKAIDTRPDVAIIDFSLPGMNGIEATRQIRARAPTVGVLIFSMHESLTLKSQALEAGARAYLLKSEHPQHLIASVAAAATPDPKHHTRDSPSETEIRATLEAILVTEIFRTSPQLATFLRFVVEAELRDEGGYLKGYTIAVEALGRQEDFDPSKDPIVRVEAGRLRRALQRYYNGPGAYNLVAIDIPRGHYVPTFRYRSVDPLAPALDGKSFRLSPPNVLSKLLEAIGWLKKFISRWRA